MRFKKGGTVIELPDPNTFILAERAGFEPVEDEEEGKHDYVDIEALRAQAKELGIRNAHSMGREKLLEKIAEANKE
jgi:hypothetical protein